jgi:hypothetical protein
MFQKCMLTQSGMSKVLTVHSQVDPGVIRRVLGVTPARDEDDTTLVPPFITRPDVTQLH